MDMITNNHPKDGFLNVSSGKGFIVMVIDNIKLFKSHGLVKKFVFSLSFWKTHLNILIW